MGSSQYVLPAFYILNPLVYQSMYLFMKDITKKALKGFARTFMIAFLPELNKGSAKNK